MEHSIKYQFLMSQLTFMEDIKETEKTKISVVYHQELRTSCILRICKNRDLSAVCKVLRDIRNPNTVVVYDYVYENGDTYILEENIDGHSLAEVMEENGTFSEDATAKIIIDVCKALEDLHREKPPIVHNDINISNIMLRADQGVKLIDFDISRCYKKGQRQNTVLFGTEEYASPEHFGYGQSEPRTDIYCLGVTMHKMLTNKVLSTEHRVTYKGRLKKIIQKCLEFDPKNRYASVSAVRKDLEKFLNRRKRLFRRMLGTIGAVVAVCGIVVGAILVNMLQDEKNDGINAEQNSNMITEQSTGSNHTGAVEQNDTANTPTQSTEQETSPVLQKNDSRESAREVEVNQSYADIIEVGAPDWYKFTTSENLSAYRLGLSGVRSSYSITVALYNKLGIKLEEFDLYFEEYDFLDLYLDADTEYFVKVYTEYNDSDRVYELHISEMLCDAGIDQDNATALMLGSMHTAVLNSTLSDWYVFTVPEDRQYIVSLHNIDVGCTIQMNRDGHGTNQADNEDNCYTTFSGKEGQKVYIEVSAFDDDPTANGNYIIEIEKDYR